MVWKLVKAIVLAAFKKRKEEKKKGRKKRMKKKARARFDHNSNMIFSTALTNK